MTEAPVTDVLVAGYQDIERATRDFESLVARHEAETRVAAAQGINA